MLCLGCATRFENTTFLGSHFRKRHNIETCRGYSRGNDHHNTYCHLHIHQRMLKGGICILCRPNIIVLGVGQREIQKLTHDTPQYVFLYGVENSIPYSHCNNNNNGSNNDEINENHDDDDDDDDDDDNDDDDNNDAASNNDQYKVKDVQQQLSTVNLKPENFSTERPHPSNNNYPQRQEVAAAISIMPTGRRATDATTSRSSTYGGGAWERPAGKFI